MLGRGKNELGVIEMVDTESLVPPEHLLRKMDAAVDFEKLYEIIEPLYKEKRDVRASTQWCCQDCAAAAFGWEHLSTVSYNFSDQEDKARGTSSSETVSGGTAGRGQCGPGSPWEEAIPRQQAV